METSSAEQGAHSSALCDDLEGTDGWGSEGGSRKKRYMYIYSGLTSLYSRKEHNTVKQLYSNLKKKTHNSTVCYIQDTHLKHDNVGGLKGKR